MGHEQACFIVSPNFCVRYTLVRCDRSFAYSWTVIHDTHSIYMKNKAYAYKHLINLMFFILFYESTHYGRGVKGCNRVRVHLMQINEVYMYHAITLTVNA